MATEEKKLISRRTHTHTHTHWVANISGRFSCLQMVITIKLLLAADRRTTTSVRKFLLDQNQIKRKQKPEKTPSSLSSSASSSSIVLVRRRNHLSIYIRDSISTQVILLPKSVAMQGGRQQRLFLFLPVPRTIKLYFLGSFCLARSQ